MEELHAVAGFVDENKQGALARVFAQVVLGDGPEAVVVLAHVNRRGVQVDLKDGGKCEERAHPKTLHDKNRRRQKVACRTLTEKAVQAAEQIPGMPRTLRFATSPVAHSVEVFFDGQWLPAWKVGDK